MRHERAVGATFALTDLGWLDFESRSPTCDIRCGSYRYATEADAIVLSYALGDGPVRVVAVESFDRGLRWDDMPEDFKAFRDRIARGEAHWVAWNAGFDRAIWNFSTDFPYMMPHHIIDAMTQATASGLVGDLASASKQAGGTRKLASGKKLIALFCTPKSEGTPSTHPEQWREFLEYAAADVNAMRDVFQRTRHLALAEWRESWAMESVNDRGVGIDVKMVEHAAELARQDRRRSAVNLLALTGGVVGSVDQVARLTHWLLARLPAEGCAILTKVEAETDEDGVELKPAKYQLIRKKVELLLALLASRLDSEALRQCHRVLQIRLFGGGKTPTKFARMRDQHVDGVLYGQYVFGGAAQTGRASSKGVQIHNLNRSVLPYEHEAIEALLRNCNYDELATLGDDTPVARKLALLIRPAFVSREMNLFVWSDWSQIEARVLPWLCGDSQGALDRLSMFRAVDADPTLPDLYTSTAVSLNPAAPDRQSGKITELALGFGGGVGALQNMAANYDIHIPDPVARELVGRWRDANPWCVEFWNTLSAAVRDAISHPRQPHAAGRLRYIYLPEYFGGSLLCRLPSGRLLTYRSIREDLVDDLDKAGKVCGQTWHMRFSRGHGRVKLWHGILCENAVQAVAADCLRGTLRRLEDEGFQTRLHTHDEVVVECDAGETDTVRAALREVMRRGFDWSDGMPLMSDETIAPYYTKVKLKEST